ncbi:MAG: phosphatase PAP2 family protein [Bacteroidales bacterium]|nr:phosphatase PAP2 family protein [Bacteroidales bacterium]MBN2820783.1 phosphatase PAP2 family protein [Bacteroidales bacterium]
MENFKTPAIKKKWLLKFIEVIDELISLLRNKKFYIGIAFLFGGIQLNFVSQTYLHNYMVEGKALPVLSDLILDNLPYWDVDYLYDIFSLVSVFVFIVYVLHKREYNKVPYFLLLCGIFHTIRAIFIVLTPFGNPPLFDGTEGPFNGFSKYELGVYPSGHTGIAYMYFILAKDRRYRLVLLFSVLVIIAALFLSRGHYSIDVLSGIFFAFAIKAYGDKYISGLMINENRRE